MEIIQYYCICAAVYFLCFGYFAYRDSPAGEKRTNQIALGAVFALIWPVILTDRLVNYFKRKHKRNSRR